MGDSSPKVLTQQDLIIAEVNMTWRPFSRDQYEKFFRDADNDKDGYLSLKELSRYFRANGYNGTELDVKRMFQAVDIDVDDKVSYNEFLIAMGQKPEESYEPVDIFRRVFALFDKDGSGEIDKRELKNVFNELGRHMSEEEVQRAMQLADSDGSGTLNYEEFIEAVIHSDTARKARKRKVKK